MPITILHIEDEQDLLMMTRIRLEHEGYVVLSASDGKTGLAMAQKHKPDMILLDLNIPQQDGKGVCQTLKEDPELGLIPVIIISASVHYLEDTAREIGAIDYLTKPYEAEELLGKIRKHL